MKQRTKIAIALGSNLGDSKSTIERALERLQEDLLEEAKVSSLYDSVAWPEPSHPPFLNAVVTGFTDWKPPGIVNFLKHLERELGRQASTEKNAPRIIDLDLLVYGEQKWSSDGVEVPHPRMAARAFVLLPLNEVWPDWKEPSTGYTALELLSRLTETVRVETKKSVPLQLDKEIR